MRRFALAFALVPLLPLPVHAASCSVATTITMAFAAYNVFNSSDDTTTGTLTINCHQSGVPFTASMNAGTSSQVNPRLMSGTAGTLQYNIFLDATYATIFGDGTLGTSTYSGNTTSATLDYPVTLYGKIPALQNAAVGSYSDSLTITVSF